MLWRRLHWGAASLGPWSGHPGPSPTLVVFVRMVLDVPEQIVVDMPRVRALAAPDGRVLLQPPLESLVHLAVRDAAERACGLDRHADGSARVYRMVSAWRADRPRGRVWCDVRAERRGLRHASRYKAIRSRSYTRVSAETWKEGLAERWLLRRTPLKWFETAVSCPASSTSAHHNIACLKFCKLSLSPLSCQYLHSGLDPAAGRAPERRLRKCTMRVSA